MDHPNMGIFQKQLVVPYLNLGRNQRTNCGRVFKFDNIQVHWLLIDDFVLKCRMQSSKASAHVMCVFTYICVDVCV